MAMSARSILTGCIDPMSYTGSIHLFHRDLRLHDNRALHAALKQSQRVLPCFILDKTLLKQLRGDLPRVQYMLCALRDLDADLRKHGSRLHVLFDEPAKALTALQKSCGAQAVFFHRDAGPYAIKRDARLQAQAAKLGMACHVIDDISLHAPEQTCKADGSPYTVFTPFFRRAFLLPVAKPVKPDAKKLFTLGDEHGDFDSALHAARLRITSETSPAAQAKSALRQLGVLHDYTGTRDLPAVPGTSRLSSALRFGLLSVREVWWAIAQTLGPEHALLRQLYWRDFFFSIGLYFPRVFRGCFHSQYDAIHWPNRAEWLAAWREGCTGFPIVDAGMRELRHSGYMHNRVRMIVASFLVKDLHCNWQLGERHFAGQLIDYDPCINNGNWQWAASTGCDAQPYFRIFNPWTQQQKFDADALYVKHWLPSLQALPPKTLHNLFKLDEALPGYVRPLVDHALQAPQAKAWFAAAPRFV